MNTKDEFDDWIIEMDQRLEMLSKEVPKSVAANLDYSPESLNVLEKWVISSFDSPKTMIEKNRYLLDRVASYVGETFRKQLGGTWSILLSDPKNVYFGLPVIRRDGKAPICPHSVASASVDRRTGDYIRAVLENS